MMLFYSLRNIAQSRSTDHVFSETTPDHASRPEIPEGAAALHLRYVGDVPWQEA